MFQPHKVDTKVSVLYSPDYKIKISYLAYKKMQYYVDHVNDEVGWLGTATNPAPGILYIGDVFLFDQQVHGATCEITVDGLTKFAEKLLQEPTGMETYNNMRLWGHSHVNMGTSPSQQDEQQMMFFKDSGHTWFLRLIANKKGDMTFTLFDYKTGIKVYDIGWELDMPDMDGLEERVIAEIAEKVKKFSATPSATYQQVTQIGFGGKTREDIEEEWNEEYYQHQLEIDRNKRFGKSKVVVFTKDKTEDEKKQESVAEELAYWLEFFSEENLFEMTKMQSRNAVRMYMNLANKTYEFEEKDATELFTFIQENGHIIYEALKELYPKDSYQVTAEAREIIRAIITAPDTEERP